MTEKPDLKFLKRGENIDLKSGKNIILDLVYPRRCPLCNEIRPYKKEIACPECLQKLKRVKPPYCLKCGKGIEDEQEEYCQDCMLLSKSFKRGYPVFEYTEGIKKALYDFKYNNQRAYAEFFADCIYWHCGKQLKALKTDGLVPVPVHARKRRSRGYNQAELLAKELSLRLQAAVYPQYLVRQVNTNPQKDLNDISRMKNLKNAFKIGQNEIKLKKILLVDDIYTSGATIESCTKVLLSAGAEEIYYTSVAVGKGF